MLAVGRTTRAFAKKKKNDDNNNNRIEKLETMERGGGGQGKVKGETEGKHQQKKKGKTRSSVCSGTSRLLL